MTELEKKIGMAPFFFSDLSLEERFSEAQGLSLSDHVFWKQDICLFRLPEYLRRRWWNEVAEESLNNDVSSPKFDAFVEAFKDFAHFKGIPLSLGLGFDVLIRPPGLDFQYLHEKNVVGLVNLGDEASVIQIVDDSVSLESGEGCWLPDNCEMRLQPTIAKKDLDALLVVYDIGVNDQLQKGIHVYSTISSELLTEKLSVSQGVCLADEVDERAQYVKSARVPRLPWRDLSDNELMQLATRDTPTFYTDAVALVNIPQKIMEPLTKLKLHESIDENDFLERVNSHEGEQAILGAEEFARSLSVNDYELERKIIYNPPNLRTVTRRPGETGCLGLHIDYSRGQSIFSRKYSSNRISINLSNGDRYFVFINLSVHDLIRLLKPANSCSTDELVDAFFKKFPDYPVTRVAVSPGEAYIAPTQNIIHDGIGPKDGPDVHLTFCGHIRLL